MDPRFFPLIYGPRASVYLYHSKIKFISSHRRVISYIIYQSRRNSDISRDVTGTVGNPWEPVVGKKRAKQLKICLLINGSFISMQDLILKPRQITDFDVLFPVALMAFR